MKHPSEGFRNTNFSTFIQPKYDRCVETEAKKRRLRIDVQVREFLESGGKVEKIDGITEPVDRKESSLLPDPDRLKRRSGEPTATKIREEVRQALADGYVFRTDFCAEAVCSKAFFYKHKEKFANVRQIGRAYLIQKDQIGILKDLIKNARKKQGKNK